MKDIVFFEQPIIVDIKKHRKITDCDITIKDIPSEKLQDEFSSDFLKNGEFNQLQYNYAVANKILKTSKPFILKFLLYQIEYQHNPLEWLDKFYRLTNSGYGSEDDYFPNIPHRIIDIALKDSNEIINVILNEPRYHFEKLNVSADKAIKLNLSLPEIRILNKLLVNTKIIEAKNLHLLETVLSKNFSTKGSADKIQKSSLLGKRNEFNNTNIESVEKLLNYMKIEIKKIEKDLYS